MSVVLELAILGLLKQRPMHGYDLRKRLREDFGPLANLSFGSLYPALARLEAGRAVRATTRDSTTGSSRRPPSSRSYRLARRRAGGARRPAATAKAAAALGGRGTRARKVYEITADGEVLFEQLLEAPDGARRGRRAASRCASPSPGTSSPPARIRLLERRRIQLADRLERPTRPSSRRARTLDRYERGDRRARDARPWPADLVWVERLLARGRTRSEQAGGAAARGRTASGTRRSVPRARHVRATGVGPGSTPTVQHPA